MNANMANFGRSFKPTSYFSPTRRPAGPTRSRSNMSSPAMSDLSPLSSPDIRSEDIVFSARASPVPLVDNPRSPPGYLRMTDHHTCSPTPRSVNTTANDSSSPITSTTPSATRSKPIAIELPSRNSSSAPISTPTPPAPLSARGDLPGGYFPSHEDQNRVYRPHPFQLDATKARMKSIQRAHRASSSDLQSLDNPDAHREQQQSQPAESTSPSRAERMMQLPHLNITEFKMPERRTNNTSNSNTPVASYMPLGDLQSPLPMGKYYPSNYEKRKEGKRRAAAAANAQLSQHRQSASDTPSFGSSKSESQVPTLSQTKTSSPTTTSSPHHSRNESEAKRRLQQYQRDMIAQATIALNGGNLNNASTITSLRSMGLTGFSSHMITTNPNKPRLVPLGSPGPVTPMELEQQAGGDESGGYLGARGPVDPQVEIARAIQRAEDEQRRRRGGEAASPPQIDAESRTSGL